MPTTDMTVPAYLRTLPAARAKELRRVRAVIRKHLQPGFAESLRGTTIVYEVPLARHATTYNGQPLWLAALGAPKSYLTLHLMPVYGSPTLLAKLRAGFEAAGLPLRMGKACINFTTADELALDVVGDIIGALSVDQWVAIAEGARTSRRKS